MASRPNVLFLMTDQQRHDAVGAWGNALIDTPNIDRLVARGVSFENAYSTNPVCVPARYTIRSGCESPRTRVWGNGYPDGGHAGVQQRCGPFLATAMGARGYRTFGVGKFHTMPAYSDEGFDVQLFSEELYATTQERAADAYASWLAREHPGYDWVDALMGERGEMYYMPQQSAVPAPLGVESWAADRAIELIEADDARPWFGFVSFIGPHPPLAPPSPFHRRYDPDAMPAPVLGELAVDHLDDQIPWMNYMVFAEDVDPVRARVLKARYYGEISYIDQCVGRVLDCVGRRGDADNTVICFFSDHGDLLGDHHGWQKENYFEAATRIPFLVSWPAGLPAGARSDMLVSLADLFGLATTAAGRPELRDGVDLLGALEGSSAARDVLFGYHRPPGSAEFKAMVRRGPEKMIWMANGGHSLLFDVAADPDETKPLDHGEDHPLLAALVGELERCGVTEALEAGRLRRHAYQRRARRRLLQFDASRGITGYGAA